MHTFLASLSLSMSLFSLSVILKLLQGFIYFNVDYFNEKIFIEKLLILSCIYFSQTYINTISFP